MAFRPPSAGLFEDTLIVVNGIPSSSETLKVALVGRGILINVLDVGDAQAFAGDMDVEVSLSILNNDTLRGVEFDLIFDADSLTLVDVKTEVRTGCVAYASLWGDFGYSSGH